MPIILAWLSFLFLFCIFGYPKFSSGSKRHDFLVSAVAWGVLLVASTEVLGIFHALNFVMLFSFWFVTAAALGFVAFRLKPNFDFQFPRLSLSESLAVGAVVGIAGMLGLIAWIAPPNNSDSMAYHMSRVVHWMQNESLANYPTNILRQLTYPPGAEYIILHFQILSGSDRFANFVQWFAMVGSVLGVSLIAKYLGAGRRAQILAAVMAATIPMGILQASGTQNDYVVTFWLVCFVAIAYTIVKRLNIFNVLLSASALGLCFLTKGTGYLYGIPFLVVLSVYGFRAHGMKWLTHLVVILAIAMFLNVGYLTRNAQLYNTNILAPATQTVKIHNQSLTPVSFVKNILKNAGIHVSTPSKEINKAIHATTNPLHEDNAGNFLHLIVLVVAGVVFLSKLKSVDVLVKYYLLAIVLGIVVFNLGLDWRPFHGRFHLPIFILLAPWAAVVLSNVIPAKAGIQRELVWMPTFVGMTVLFLGSLPWLLFNEARPVLGPNNIFKTPRVTQYFANLSGLEYSYRSAAEEIMASSCRDVGIKLRENSWEYPFWVFAGKGVRIEHVSVTNVSANDQKFQPCAVVVIDSEGNEPKKILGDRVFVRTRYTAYTQTYLLDETGHLSRRSLEYYFNDAVNWVNQSVQTKDIQKIIYLRTKALESARLVELDELARLSPQLAKAWRSQLLEGLERFKSGVEHRDEKTLATAQELIGQWQIWLVENKSNLIKVFADEE